MRQVKTLNVSLTPELHALVTAQVASGRYGSASEVVRAGLRLLEESERSRQVSEPPRKEGGQQLGR